MQDINNLLAFLYCVLQVVFYKLAFYYLYIRVVMGFFNNANKNFASFGIVICIIYLCFASLLLRSVIYL